MPYIPCLDGLRGIAIYLVVMFHLDLMPGGWIGVDVFFTLSGFLITSLLLAEWETKRAIGFRRFYASRALRLLPALLVMVSVCWLLGLIADPRGELLPVIFYCVNFSPLLSTRVGPLDHTWSLSIEEQFYFVWPVTLALLVKAGLSRARIGQCLMIAISCLVAWRLILWWVGSGRGRIYFWTDTRIDEILWGCALACALPRLQGRFRAIDPRWALLGMVVVLGLAQMADMFAIGWLQMIFVIVPLLTCLLIGISTVNSIPILKAKPLVFLGKISYGLYLWHHPVFYFCAQWSWPPWLWVTGGLALTFAMTLASYYLIERPFLRIKDRLRMMSGGLFPATG